MVYYLTLILQSDDVELQSENMTAKILLSVPLYSMEKLHAMSSNKPSLKEFGMRLIKKNCVWDFAAIPNLSELKMSRITSVERLPLKR